MEETVLAGRYRIVERIGGGGMADVYKAVDDVLERTVAVKIMHERSGDPTWPERFRREARAAAALNNPHIVAVHDSGSADDAEFIVMEFVHGEDLSSVIRRDAPLSAERVAAIGYQVADALAEAHEHGVIHRDISPANILIADDGRAMVTDFGIAHVGSTRLTQTGSVLGSASYVSPEQAQGLDVGPASDLYSLGAVLFEAATGRPPFEGTGPMSVAFKHVNEPPPRPRDVRPEIDARLERVILRALQKAAQDRFSNAAEMREELRVVADSSGIGPRQPLGTEATQPLPQTAILPAAAGDASGVPEEIGPQRKSVVRRVVPWLVLAAVLIAIGFALARPLSQPADAVTVPDVTGMTAVDASRALADAGLKAEIAEERADESEPGTVLGQDPASASQAPRGSRVTLTVSTGPASVEVPNVRGMTEAAARDAIEGAGLVPTAVAPRYSTTPAGQVLLQEPEPGLDVESGSSVAYVLSLGPAPQSDGGDDNGGASRDNSDDTAPNPKSEGKGKGKSGGKDKD